MSLLCSSRALRKMPRSSGLAQVSVMQSLITFEDVWINEWIIYILFRNEKGTGAKMCPSIIVSGIITMIDQFFACTSSESQKSSRNLTWACFIHIFKVANIKRTNECLNELMDEWKNEWMNDQWSNDLLAFFYHLQSHISSSCYYPWNTEFWCTRR